MAEIDEFFGRDLPVQRFKEKPVLLFQGKVLEVDRYSDLGNGVYWFVAEEMPVAKKKQRRLNMAKKLLEVWETEELEVRVAG
ncbi:MAG: hypothetical protein LBC19_08625 [Tannerella sp.]|nr:hypothetical protein [Tannerella sp.]